MKNAEFNLCVVKSRRGGYVLVLFALAAVILFGFAALVIDLGFARLTQAQMNSAVDSAALEGLRFRDGVPQAWIANPGDPTTRPDNLNVDCPPPPGTTIDLSDPQWLDWLDCVRRSMASRQVQLVFDDDLNPENGDVFNFGAGPLVNFSDGIALPDTDFRAAETMSIPVVPVYDPDLQLNSGNDPAGDMVAGTYISDSTHIEGGDPADPAYPYDRTDFTASAAADAETAPAFLVRMRRTNETFDPALEISSNAPPIPFLFGRGTVAYPDPKANGIPIRSTAIASAGVFPDGTSVGRVMSVGPASMSNSLKGVTPFAITMSDWESGASSVSVVPIDPDRWWTLGEELIETAGLGISEDQGRYLYAPIYVDFDDAPTNERNLVIGFGAIATWEEDVPDMTVSLTKASATGTGFIASENAAATSVVVDGNGANPLATSDFDTIWNHHVSLENSLFVPVLMRSAGRAQ